MCISICIRRSFTYLMHFSLYSLCIKDDNEKHFFLFFAYFLYLFTVIPKAEVSITIVLDRSINSLQGRVRYLFFLRGLLSFFFNILEVYGSPPSRLPHLFPYLTALYSCISFLLDLVYLNYYMIHSYLIASPSNAKPKKD